MADFLSFKVEGADAINDALLAIDVKLRKSIMANATAKSNALILHAVQMETPVHTGKLKRRIRDVATRSRGKNFHARYVILPTRAMMGIKADARGYYPAHVLFGHKFPYRTNPRPGIKWRTKSVGARVAANPYVHRGFDLVESFAAEIMRVELTRGMMEAFNAAP